MNIVRLWKMVSLREYIDSEMSSQELFLELRLSRPDAFECSTCREMGRQKTVLSVLSTEELILAFEEHVESEHSILSC